MGLRVSGPSSGLRIGYVQPVAELLLEEMRLRVQAFGV